jgi:ABC-type phosphate transport system substrate-binding protein
MRPFLASQVARIAQFVTIAVGGVSGQIKSVGSDTLNNEMALWAKGFEGLYPDVKIEIEGKGSATAPPASSKALRSLARCHVR